MHWGKYVMCTGLEDMNQRCQAVLVCVQSELSGRACPVHMGTLMTSYGLHTTVG